MLVSKFESGPWKMSLQLTILRPTVEQDGEALVSRALMHDDHEK